jgi:hypothetical protein
LSSQWELQGLIGIVAVALMESVRDERAAQRTPIIADGRSVVCGVKKVVRESERGESPPLDLLDKD